MQWCLLVLCSCVSAMAAGGGGGGGGDGPKLEMIPPPLVVLSIGGFGAANFSEYPNLTADLSKYVEEFARPKRLIPVFPTKTSVNLYTVVTGLYAEQHGVIAECAYDEQPDECIYERYDQIDSIIPIWIENQLNGGTSGVINWPGSHLYYEDNKPYYYQESTKGTNYKDLVNKIFGWLENNKRPANLVMAHFDELDKALHQSSSVADEIKTINDTVCYFMNELEKKTYKNDINVIIFGSHGTSTVYYPETIKLREILKDVTPYSFIAMGTNAIVRPLNGQFKKVYKILSNYAKNTSKYNVYKKNDIPKEWHLENLYLFDDHTIFLVAKLNYCFRNPYIEGIKNELLNKDENKTEENVGFGLGGYSNDLDIMSTIFMGTGPNFIPKKEVNPFQTIDIHPLLKKLLKIKAHSKWFPRTNADVMKLLRTPTLQKSTEPLETDADKKIS